eukprot:Partr_v1_DN28788_c0_g1_i9_m62762 putative structural maintenance of chromosomes protein
MYAQKEKSTKDMEATRAQLAQLDKQLEDCEAECNTVKKAVLSLQREGEQAAKDAISMETQIEKLEDERVSIFKRCRLEEIELPLLDGSLDDIIPDESVDVSQSMDIDGGRDSSYSSSAAGKSQLIKLDFKRLSTEYKKDRREVLDIQFTDKIKSLAAEMDRMAPNLKAIEKLD